MFNRKHTDEERKKISEGVKKAYSLMTKEKNEERKSKLREINKKKSKLWEQLMK